MHAASTATQMDINPEPVPRQPLTPLCHFSGSHLERTGGCVLISLPQLNMFNLNLCHRNLFSPSRRWRRRRSSRGPS